MFDFLSNALALPLSALAFIAAAFVLGGVVKGTLGVGLPMFVIPILSHSMPPARAIAILLLPVLVSNLWQLLQSGISREGLRRFMPLVVGLVVTTLLTVRATLNLPEDTLRIIVACVVLVAVALLSFNWQPKGELKREPIWSAGVGLISGIMGGVSTLSGPLIISYLMALKLPREIFVGTVSAIYFAGAVSIYGSMIAMDQIDQSQLVTSFAALLPMSIGLLVGQRLRGKLSDQVFRRVMLGFLCVVALGLIYKTVV
jgi:uncharacterized protein